MDHANLDPAIFGPRRFVMPRVGGHFLAKTHSLNAAWRNPERKQIIPCGLASAFPEAAKASECCEQGKLGLCALCGEDWRGERDELRQFS